MTTPETSSVSLPHEIESSLASVMTWMEEDGSVLPPVAYELIVLGRLKNTIGLSLGIFLILTGILIDRYVWKRLSPTSGKVVDKVYICTYPFLLTVIPGAALIVVCFVGTLMAWFAPRIYVLELLRSYLP